MAQELESLEVFPGEKGGHRVVHNFKRKPMKGGRDLYMESPKREEHIFGKGQEKEAGAHILKTLGLSKAPKDGDSDEDGY